MELTIVPRFNISPLSLSMSTTSAKYYEDAAFLQSYEWMYKTEDRSKESITKKCKKWKPHSSIAARYLYRALDMGLAKEEFHLFK